MTKSREDLLVQAFGCLRLLTTHCLTVFFHFLYDLFYESVLDLNCACIVTLWLLLFKIN